LEKICHINLERTQKFLENRNRMKKNEPKPQPETLPSLPPSTAKKAYRKPALKRLGVLKAALSPIGPF
jgi:hypothetical protein